MASIRKRGNSWTAQVLLPTGKFRAKSFPTRPLAVAWSRDFEAARDRGELIDTGTQTIGSLWDPFVTIRAALLSANTVAKDTSQWVNHLEPAFADVPVGELRHSTVEKWVARQLRAGVVGIPTIQASVTLLGTLLEQAVRDKLILANPVRNVRIPRHVPKQARFLTTAELGLILREVELPEHQLLLALLAGTGLRIGEGLGLRAGDVAPDASTLTVRQVWTRHGYKKVPKTDASMREVPVPRHLRRRLRDHTRLMLPAAVLFQGDDRNLNQRILKPACEAAGLEWVTLHQLRHHACSVWIAAGLPLFEVSKALGHKDTRMVERVYGHLVPGAHDRLLAAMDTAQAGADL